MTSAVIGILGGMGPAATADFYAKLVSATPAVVDQDHVRALIWSDPAIPDRTAALVGSGPDPVPLLVAGAQRLQDAGAMFIAMPCNTAHAFLDRVRAHVDLPFVHMIEETCRHIVQRSVGAVGLLATTGTVRSGLYQRSLESTGTAVLTPGATDQERVVEVIARVKAGVVDDQTRRLIRQSVARIVDRGAQVIIAGCTELPLALADMDVHVPVIDPTLVLAKAAVARATNDRAFV